jgi:hypothetical protein
VRPSGVVTDRIGQLRPLSGEEPEREHDEAEPRGETRDDGEREAYEEGRCSLREQLELRFLNLSRQEGPRLTDPAVVV